MAGGHSAGYINSLKGFNLIPFILSGTVTSVMTLTGIAKGDIVAACYRIKSWTGAGPTVSNLTSVCTTSTNTLNIVGKTTASSMVFGMYVRIAGM
jgi:hypothetical protein